MTELSGDSTSSPYSLLPLQGPFDVAIGCALISLVEPYEGCDLDYNRWYEDEHMPAVFTLPWKFSGRRWVAPRDLQSLRYPQDSPLAQPLSTGKYFCPSILDYTRPLHRSQALVRFQAQERCGREGDIISIAGTPIFRGPTTAEPSTVTNKDREIHALSQPLPGCGPRGPRADLRAP